MTHFHFFTSLHDIPLLYTLFIFRLNADDYFPLIAILCGGYRIDLQLNFLLLFIRLIHNQQVAVYSIYIKSNYGVCQ